MMLDDDEAPTPFDPSQLCDRIQEMADALSWSWSDLETRAGVSRRTLENWRSGALLLRKGGVRRAAEALGIHYEEITYGLGPALDRSLVQRSIAGERAAVHTLVSILSRTIRGAVARELARRSQGRTRDQEVADITQAVFVHLFADDWKALLQWDPDRGHTLQGFVALVARNVTTAILRTRRKNPFQEEPVAPETMDESAGEGSGPESVAINRQTAAAVADRVAAGLSSLGVEMFRHLFIEERPVEEICARTGMSPDAVYQWKNRLNRRLRTLAAEIDAPAEPAAEARVAQRSEPSTGGMGGIAPHRDDASRRSSVPPASSPRSSEPEIRAASCEDERLTVLPAASDQAATNCRSTRRR